MRKLVAVAAEVQAFLETRGLSGTIIGGLAVAVRGEVRLTRDVDFVVLAEFGAEQEVVDALLSQFEARLSQTREHALQHRVVLLQRSLVPIDIALGGFDFERRMVERSTLEDMGAGTPLRVVTSEDLIVLKSFANRPQDWVDIAGILSKSSDLNWGLIFAELQPLAAIKEDPEILAKLRQLQ